MKQMISRVPDEVFEDFNDILKLQGKIRNRVLLKWIKHYVKQHDNLLWEEESKSPSNDEGE